VAKLIGMGSILQATPLLKALKQQYPQCVLTFVSMRSNEDLIRRLNCVDEVVTLDDRNVLAMLITTMTAVTKLIWRRADLYFDLELYSAFASLLALGAMTRNRLGFYRHSVAFKNGIYTHLVFFNTRMPVRLLYLQLGRVAGVPPDQPDTIGPLRVDDGDRSGADQVIAEIAGWQSPTQYIAINPNASDLLLERRWPDEHVIQAIERLVSLGHRVALIGAKNERPYVQSLVDRLPSEMRSLVANTAGRLTVGELLALLDASTCVLTNDSGPMHMAIALGRPTVCLFGPVDPEHYGQALPNVAMFYHRVFCSPCVHEVDQPPCKGNNVCMQRIEPGPVVEAVLRLCESNLSPEVNRLQHFANNETVVRDDFKGAPLGVVIRASLMSKNPS
jgi:ADP-heptose:LPS heptosyltransferase